MAGVEVSSRDGDHAAAAIMITAVVPNGKGLLHVMPISPLRTCNASYASKLPTRIEGRCFYLHIGYCVCMLCIYNVVFVFI